MSGESNDAMKAAKKLMSAIEGIVGILSPLQSDERHRAIQGALVVLRENAPNIEGLDSGSGEGSAAGTTPAAKRWMKQHAVSSNQLASVFDISDGSATVIAAQLSGKNNSEKTIKAYVLMGLASLLTVGEPTFADKAARELCEELGIYDSTNHSKYLKEKNSYLLGDKDKGWKLTQPGLKYAASIVKELAGPNDVD
jgi:hypothetical protein